MTTDVTVQAAYVALTQPDLTVSRQTAYVAILSDRRVAVTSQTVYAVIRQAAPSSPSPARRPGRLRLGIGI